MRPWALIFQPNTMTTIYQSRAPWHELGADVTRLKTPAQMADEAKLNWLVGTQPLYVNSQIGVVPNYRDIITHRALVRSTDRSVLGICGSKYLPTQNMVAIDFFRKFCESGEMVMETLGSLQGGRWIWALAKLCHGFTLDDGDRVEGYLLMSHPHIWGKSLVIQFTTIRVVCQNTLMLALRGETAGKFRMMHVHEFDDTMARKAREALGIGNRLVDHFEEQARLLTTYHMEYSDMVGYARRVLKLSEDVEAGEYQSKILDQVEHAYRSSPGSDLRSARGTLWGAMNAITYVIDHEAGRTTDQRLYEAWFGNRQHIKTRALETALEMAR